ncbi:MAG: hypothetical protein P8J45_06530 [Phycisphaerales bacterium]|nr:hypothetical protein [Phycisphaerales bacterium]
MFKFLRLYQGWILAIFGTFLVITFLLPQAIQGLFQSYAVSGGDWATVGDDENVTNGQLQMVRGELLVQDVIGTQFRTIPNLLGASKDPSYWYLLSREAEQAGLVGGAGVGRDYLASMSQQYIANGQQVSETTILLQMMGSSNFSDRQVYETLAKVQGVAQLANQFQNAARYSDERMRQAAAQLVLSADIDIVIIDAKADGSQSTPTTTDTTTDTDTDTEVAASEEPATPQGNPALAVNTPDEAALEAQFQLHKSENPGEGESGFGYKLPDRASIEWITVSKEGVRTAITETAEFDPIELRKAFINDPQAYGATTGAEPPKYSDYQELVRERMLRDLIETRMGEIEKFLSDQTQLPRRGLNRQGLDYELPEDWDQQRANFEVLAAALGEEFSMPAPENARSRELISAIEIDSLPGVGSSRSTKFGRQPTSVSQYVMASKEFGNNTTIPSQAGIAGPVFSDAAGNLHIFRVLETDPAREARSIDEVRDAVTADATTLARFEKIKALSAELETQAIEYGLQPIAENYDSQVRFVSKIAEADAQLLAYGVKQPTRIIGLSDPKTVIDAVIERASELDYTVPTTDIPLKDRTLVIADKNALAIAVVQINAIKPMTKESWSELSANAGVTRVLASDETALDFISTYSLEELIKRHDFKLLRARENDELIEDAEIEGLDATPVETTEAG